MEERRGLEDKIGKCSSQVKEDYQFELDVTLSNIQHVQEKLANAGVNF